MKQDVDVSLLCNKARKESIHPVDHFIMVKCDYMDKSSIRGLFGEDYW
jgi:hypothetical protein